MNDITKQISDLLDVLPESVKMVIYDGPLDKELEDLANEYQISIIDIEKIKGEVLLVILGINKSDTLEQTLLQKISVDKQNLKKICDEIVQRIILPLANEQIAEIHPDKETILNEIENPAPVKPIIQNPAGKNPILDAQHNLPVGEPKKLISSAAVPSRGPMLSNVKTGFTATPITPKPVPVEQPKPVTQTIPNVIPTAPVAPITPKPVTPQPFSEPQQPVQTVQPVQSPKPPQAPLSVPQPPAPDKYTIDPYRELP